MLIKISFILLVATFNVATSFEVHHHMTEDEMQDVFGTNDASDLPEYELVPVHHDAMSETHADIRIQARNNQHELKLKSIDSVLFGTNTKVWRAVYDRKYGRVQYNPVNPNFNQLFPLQDRRKRAALIKFTDEHNNTYYDGTIGSEYVVRPLPSSTLRQISQNDDYQDRKSTRCQDSDNCSYHHVIFKRDVANYDYSDIELEYTNRWNIWMDWYRQIPESGRNSEVKKYLKQQLAEANQWRREREAEIKRRQKMNPTSDLPVPEQNGPSGASQTVYPKILVVVDYPMFKLIGRDVMKTIKYVMSFMNSVDLRYKDLDDPAIKLHVAGVIIAQEQHATPYEVLSGQNKQGVSFIKGGATLRNSSEYFNRTNYFNEQIANSMAFDVVTILTGYDLCLETTEGCDAKYIGLAEGGYLCTNSDKNKQHPGNSIVQDTGNYQGILTAVHELAHVFGAISHDGQGVSSQCSDDDGYLMRHTNTVSDNHYFWSQCSKRAIRNFLSSKEGSCARDRPVTGATFSIDELPGKNLSLDEQCRSFYWHKYPEITACDSAYISKASPQMRNRNVCNMIFCKRHEKDGCTPTTSAVHGTVCGDNKHCIKGSCVPMTNAERPSQWI